MSATSDNELVTLRSALEGVYTTGRPSGAAVRRVIERYKPEIAGHVNLGARGESILITKATRAKLIETIRSEQQAEAEDKLGDAPMPAEIHIGALETKVDRLETKIDRLTQANETLIKSNNVLADKLGKVLLSLGVT